MHIFVGTVDKRRLSTASFENRLERSGYLLRVSCIEDTDTGKPLNPCEAPGHVIFEQPSIETE
jgi:hypothetical protein